MAAPEVRRADFLMALAYATDLATGHSRDFALRSCVLAMRFADVARLDEHAPRRLSSGAASLHRLQRRQPPAGGRLGRRDRAAPGASGPGLRRQGGVRRGLRQSHHAPFAGASPEELAEAVQRGLAQAPQVNVPILSGHCEVAQRIAERLGLPQSSARASARFTSAGTEGVAAGPVGRGGEIPGPAGDAGSGRHRADRGPRLRDHDGDDRQARRRRLRAGAGRLFLAHAER